MNVCVFCASSNDVAGPYFRAARELGEQIAARRWTLVYGGGNVGLMGVLAEAVREGKGRIVGVIPEALRDRELAYPGADEMIVTADLRERKSLMDEKANAFIALPGGFGTLDEVVETITLKQLKFHDRPVVFVNIARYYDRLFAWIDHVFEERFAPGDPRDLYSVARSAAEAVRIIEENT